MSGSEEKLIILKMLEEGKISSEEAMRLLDAINDTSKNFSKNNNTQNKSNLMDEINKIKEKAINIKKDIINKNTTKDFENMVDDFTSKVEKVGQNLANSTFGLADKITDFIESFVDSSSFDIFGKFNITEKVFEAQPISNTDLKIKALNGNITIKKHKESKIFIRSKIKAPNNQNEIINFVCSENIILLDLNKIKNASISHEIFLPEINFKSISLETSNGKIYVEDSHCETFDAVTTNNEIDLKGIESRKFNISAKNAKIQVGYIVGSEVDINTTNSKIDIKHVKIEKLKAVSSNGKILVDDVQNYQNTTSIELDIKTSNSDIKINMNDSQDKVYKINACTTNSKINLLVPNITVSDLSNNILDSKISAESTNLDFVKEKVLINAETINGFIEIIK